MKEKSENKKRKVKAIDLEISLIPLRFKLLVIFD